MRGIDRLIQITTFTAINVELKISIIEFNPKAHFFGCIDGWHLDQANLNVPILATAAAREPSPRLGVRKRPR